MSSRNTVFGIMVALLFAFAASAVFAGGPFSVTQENISTGYQSGTLSYHGGTYVANLPSGETAVLFGGTWQGRGCSLQSPVWFNAGIAGYDQSYAATWNNAGVKHVTEAAKFSSPLMTPVSNTNGDLMFAAYSTDFVLQANVDNTTKAVIPFAFMNKDAWWVVDAAFGPNNTSYYVGQDIYELQGNGYHVAAERNGSWWDTGIRASQVEYAQNRLWATRYDHSGIDCWDYNSQGGLWKSQTVVEGGYYTMLGNDNSGIVFADASNIWHASAVPEPSSVLALGSGFGALFLRRQYIMRMRAWLRK